MVRSTLWWSDTIFKKFPSEKCSAEGRYILSPEEYREQGSIGEYSDPIFQRRLVIVTERAIIMFDYLYGEEEHNYDALYHPMGSCYIQNADFIRYTERFTLDAFSAGQFVTNCNWYQSDSVVKLEFTYEQEDLQGQTMR